MFIVVSYSCGGYSQFIRVLNKRDHYGPSNVQRDVSKVFLSTIDLPTEQARGLSCYERCNEFGSEQILTEMTG